jgi:hypothetical protein
MKLRKPWQTLVVFGCGILIALVSPTRAQQTAPASTPTALSKGASAALEWPVTFQQTVTAGMNAVGTKAQAKLLIATQFNGTVVPAGAVLSGEVVESQAKSATTPSRLAIRMNRVQWKDVGPFEVKLYLTHWYHPFRPIAREEGPAQPYEHGEIGLRAAYPQEQPGRILQEAVSDSGGLVSPKLLAIKNVEATSCNDGTVVLTSNKSNIKLDKGIIYVLGVNDLSPQ